MQEQYLFTRTKLYLFYSTGKKVKRGHIYLSSYVVCVREFSPLDDFDVNQMNIR